MSEKGWTPGPWIVERNSDGVFIRADAPFPDDWYVARASANNGMTEANAALIAAAPALYARLERMTELLSDLPAGRNYLGDIEASRAALASARPKSRGGESR